MKAVIEIASQVDRCFIHTSGLCVLDRLSVAVVTAADRQTDRPLDRQTNTDRQTGIH